MRVLSIISDSVYGILLNDFKINNVIFCENLIQKADCNSNIISEMNSNIVLILNLYIVIKPRNNIGRYFPLTFSILRCFEP